VRRNLKNFMTQAESPMDDFWGGRDWRELPAAKQAAGNVAGATPDKVIRSFVSEFKRKLVPVRENRWVFECSNGFASTMATGSRLCAFEPRRRTAPPNPFPEVFAGLPRRFA
jgi:hypothetical protein